MNEQQGAVDYLFDEETLADIASYISYKNPIEVYAEAISGRMLEEQVELHLASGGTARSALAHVVDALANESFKLLKNSKSTKDAYPSQLNPGYNRDEIITELADNFIMWNINRQASNIDLEEIAAEVCQKLAKLGKAREEGRLIYTEKGTVYIDKDKD